MYTSSIGLLTLSMSAFQSSMRRSVLGRRSMLDDLIVETFPAQNQRDFINTGNVFRSDDRSLGNVAESAIFAFISAERKRSVRHSRMSAWIPISSSSFTLCCVGFVFNSPAVGMNGTSVR